MPSEMPKVSVIIPSYNRGNYLPEAIASVLAQTYTSYEVIVVDDGSTDNTRERLQKFIQHNEIRYYYQKNRGSSGARNAGISLAQGEYITFLDSDDLYLPTKLARQVEVLENNPDIALVHCNYSKFNDDGEDLGQRNTSFFSNHVYPEMLLYWRTLIATPCVMVRSKLFDEVGLFDENLRGAEDLDMWRRIARRYPMGTVRESLVRVRVHSSNSSGDPIQSAQTLRAYLEKALSDDPQLSRIFQRRAKSNMHLVIAHNVLGGGSSSQMSFVRKNLGLALGVWPIQITAYFSYLLSYLPLAMRMGLASLYRNFRSRSL